LLSLYLTVKEMRLSGKGIEKLSGELDMRPTWVFRFVTIFVAVIATGLGCCAIAQMPSLSESSMLDCSGMPCADVTVANGTHLKMLVDTGNPNSVLDLAKATELGMQLKPLMGPDGKPYARYSVGTIKDVRLGDVSLGDVEFLVANLQPAIQKGVRPSADGSLAYTAFEGRILKMDYKGQRVSVSEVLKTDIPCPGVCGTLTTPTFGKEGPPILATTGFQLNGKPVTVQIDTLYGGTMLIYPTSVEKLGLTAEQQSTKIRQFPYTDGGVDMIEGVAKTEGFDKDALKKDAPLYFATPKVHLPDGLFDGTVGHELFTGRVVTMDFHAHHFWII
jgi:Aspartyl protease